MLRDLKSWRRDGRHSFLLSSLIILVGVVTSTKLDDIIQKKGRTTIFTPESTVFKAGDFFLRYQGQSIFEASRGINPYTICNLRDKRHNGGYSKGDSFCLPQDEPIPDVFSIITSHFQSDQWGIFTPCPDTREECSKYSTSNITSGKNERQNMKEQGQVGNLTVKSCLSSCLTTVNEGEVCSQDVRCEDGSFCKRESGNDTTGICVSECPEDPEHCLEEVDMFNRKSCLECNEHCTYAHWGYFEVDNEIIMANGFRSTTPLPIGEVIAPLVDCSDLTRPEVEHCPDAKDSICLINNYIDSPEEEVAKKCANSGGLAMVMFFSAEKFPYEDSPSKSLIVTPIDIPAILIAYNKGTVLQGNKIGSTANVTTTSAHRRCNYVQFCSNTVPCITEGEYCKYLDDGEDTGFCDKCPLDPLNCFFPPSPKILIDSHNVESCAATCAASIEFGTSCKTCGDTITGFEFGVENPSEDRCKFCPQDDMIYPQREVPFFSVGGAEVKCWQVQSFFGRVDIDKESTNCMLSQAQNYICGCEGTGYAGANTLAKQNALVWMPRVAAILSVLGSAFIITDILRVRSRRHELYQQMMICMSIFDIIGSIAYAFTSAPIPTEYHLQGAHGNDATCTAQGFFIQVGAVAGYTNVSLAFYYLCAITKGMDESRVSKFRLWFLISPIVVGLTFAVSGLSYYGNMFLWCNNTASWWPDIPIAVAIVVATVVMGFVCWDVHNKVQVFKREQERGEGYNGRTLSTKVFWQSFWYLMGFYMTWPPYLALQFVWSSGKGYTNYNFILFAGTVVPLQGVWNCFNYTRTRHLKHARGLFVELVSNVLGQSTRRQLSADGFTEQETRYTSIGATTTTAPLVTNTKSLFEDYDDELLTYFSGASMQSQSDVVCDPNYWIANNDSVPILSSFYPVLHSSVTIPNGSALLISERIKQVLCSRSIAAVYDSRAAKADCVTKQNVSFRIRLYRKNIKDLDTIIVEIQRREGFDVMFQKDVFAIFDAAEGISADPTLDEAAPIYQDVEDDMVNYTASSLNRICSIMFPENGESMVRDIDMVLQGLLSLTDVNKVGKTAALVCRDLFLDESFSRLRDLIFSYAAGDEGGFSSAQCCVKLQSLEIIANAVSCLNVDSQTNNLALSQSFILHLVSLVDNAVSNSRAADLACLILKNTTGSQSLDDDGNTRLNAALVNASMYGNEAHADLEMHSQECLRLIYGVKV